MEAVNDILMEEEPIFFLLVAMHLLKTCKELAFCHPRCHNGKDISWFLFCLLSRVMTPSFLRGL